MSASRFDFLATHPVMVDAVDPEAVIVDGGASLGAFIEAVRGVPKLAATRIVAIEASPELTAGLCEAGRPNCTVVHAALVGDGEESNVVFRAGHNHDSGNVVLRNVTESPHRQDPETTVPAISLRALLEAQKIDRITLLKLDIEGAEASVFRTFDQQLADRIDQITMEWHPWVALDLDIGECLEGFGYCVTRHPNDGVHAIAERLL